MLAQTQDDKGFTSINEVINVVCKSVACPTEIVLGTMVCIEANDPANLPFCSNGKGRQDDNDKRARDAGKGQRENKNHKDHEAKALVPNGPTKAWQDAGQMPAPVSTASLQTPNVDAQVALDPTATDAMIDFLGGDLDDLEALHDSSMSAMHQQDGAVYENREYEGRTRGRGYWGLRRSYVAGAGGLEHPRTPEIGDGYT